MDTTTDGLINHAIDEIIDLDDSRRRDIYAPFDPVSGFGSVGKRFTLDIPDFPIPRQSLPISMKNIPLVKRLARYKTLDIFITKALKLPPTPENRSRLVDAFTRLRALHDFPFWAAVFVFIKNKNISGDPEIRFNLNRPQRKLIDALESQRLASRPIRIVLLKARQWGGSTLLQIYMAWMQLIHSRGLNSLIIAHQGTASDEIKDMFDRMINAYPVNMLHLPAENFSLNERKMVSVGRSGSIFRIPARNCKIKIGTAERPDSCRGGDYALVHLSEVGLWKDTDGKHPSDIVRAATAGVLNVPGTMIVYESTANGHGNFFHHEYIDARDNPSSPFRNIFIPWYDIDWNIAPFSSQEQRRAFARDLYLNRDASNAPSTRQEPGRYLWWMWQRGATLEAINWYITERAKHTSHGSMAAECPSDDVEAFVNSGAAVFDKYLVERFRHACRPPRYIGEISARQPAGPLALQDIKFHNDSQGLLYIWNLPDNNNPADDTVISNRYLTVVDVGGRSDKADYSVIVVFDRIAMIDGEPPAVVAQWRGHIDIDLLAFKAAQIAAFYDNALLVIESNTLETRDPLREVDGDQSLYILNQIKDIYPNLYARRPSEEDIRLGRPRKYGFHTNTATKPMIISALIKYVRELAYVEADARVLDEYLDYERKPGGAYGAIAGSHDDLLMTRAIGLHICFSEMPLPAITQSSATTFSRAAAIRPPL